MSKSNPMHQDKSSPLRESYNELLASHDRLLAATKPLVRWSEVFIKKTPISAETLWREFPKAIEVAREAIQQARNL